MFLFLLSDWCIYVKDVYCAISFHAHLKWSTWLWKLFSSCLKILVCSLLSAYLVLRLPFHCVLAVVALSAVCNALAVLGPGMCADHSSLRHSVNKAQTTKLSL